MTMSVLWDESRKPSWQARCWVGHLPFLSRLAGFLVTGNPEIHVVRFLNAGIVCLKGEQGRWSVSWVMTPDLLT